MSRGPDNIIVEHLQRSPLCVMLPHSQIVAEEIIEALEAEDYWIVPKGQVKGQP